MKATLRPRSGKYYGTEIIIDFEDHDQSKGTIVLWGNNDTEPSVRELSYWGYSQNQWDNNENVPNGFGVSTPIRNVGITRDCHFESETTYKRAIKLIKAINSYHK